VQLNVADLVLDPADRSVTRNGVAIELSPTEFALLLQFMRSPDQVLSRTYLLEHVWDFAYDGTSNVVDVYIRYLREKIDRPFNRNSLQTVRGAGYVLRSSPE
jgi:two-component system, OmpR family, response regulator